MAGELIRVHSAEEEYVHLTVTPCRSCGLGPLAPASINLIAVNNKPVDRFTAVCQKCGQKAEFDYDLSDFFGQQRSPQPGVFNPTTTPSAAVDLFGWVSLATLLASNCQSEKDPVDMRQMALEAQQCLSEAIKFYADDSETPPESAFWTPEGREDFATHPQNYTKQSLLEIRRSLPNTGSAIYPSLPSTKSGAFTRPEPAAQPKAAQPKKSMLGFFRK